MNTIGLGLCDKCFKVMRPWIIHLAIFYLNFENSTMTLVIKFMLANFFHIKNMPRWGGGGFNLSHINNPWYSIFSILNFWVFLSISFYKEKIPTPYIYFALVFHRVFGFFPFFIRKKSRESSSGETHRSNIFQRPVARKSATRGRVSFFFRGSSFKG